MTNVLKARQGDPPAACKGVFNILSACECGGNADNAVGLLHIPGSGGTPTLLPGPSAPCPAQPCGSGIVQSLRSNAGTFFCFK